MTANYALLPQVYPSEEGWDNKQAAKWVEVCILIKPIILGYKAN